LCECPIQPQAIAGHGADEFDVHPQWGRFATCQGKD
jgi:hypothetical protein